MKFNNKVFSMKAKGAAFHFSYKFNRVVLLFCGRSLTGNDVQLYQTFFFFSIYNILINKNLPKEMEKHQANKMELVHICGIFISEYTSHFLLTIQINKTWEHNNFTLSYSVTVISPEENRMPCGSVIKREMAPSFERLRLKTSRWNRYTL